MFQVKLIIVKFFNYLDLVYILDLIEPSTIEIHYKHGLPRNIDTNALISVVNLNEPDGKKLNFYSYPRINNESLLTGKNKNSKLPHMYDIHTFDLNVENGFSIFMTKDEREAVKQYCERRRIKKENGEVKEQETLFEKNKRLILVRNNLFIFRILQNQGKNMQLVIYAIQNSILIKM